MILAITKAAAARCEENKLTPNELWVVFTKQVESPVWEGWRRENDIADPREMPPVVLDMDTGAVVVTTGIDPDQVIYTMQTREEWEAKIEDDGTPMVMVNTEDHHRKEDGTWVSREGNRGSWEHKLGAPIPGHWALQDFSV